MKSSQNELDKILLQNSEGYKSKELPKSDIIPESPPATGINGITSGGVTFFEREEMLWKIKDQIVFELVLDVAYDDILEHSYTVNGL